MTRTRSFTIGELARRTGASIKALRLYDHYGLLVTVGRSEGNYRLFTDDALACVRAIKTLQAAGLSLRDMRDLTRIWGRPDFRGRFSELLADALDRTDAKLARLQSSRRALAELLRLSGSVRDEEDIAELLTLPPGAGLSVCRDGCEDGIAARASGGRP